MRRLPQSVCRVFFSRFSNEINLPVDPAGTELGGGGEGARKTALTFAAKTTMWGLRSHCVVQHDFTLQAASRIHTAGCITDSHCRLHHGFTLQAASRIHTAGCTVHSHCRVHCAFTLQGAPCIHTAGCITDSHCRVHCAFTLQGAPWFHTAGCTLPVRRGWGRFTLRECVLCLQGSHTLQQLVSCSLSAS